MLFIVFIICGYCFLQAIEVAQIMDEALDDKNSGLVLRCISISNSRLFISCSKSTQSSASESAATFLSCLSASWVYSKVVLLGISFLERERRYVGYNFRRM